ncbi:hypothetical protein ACFTQ7_13960 [Lysinibacillus sp. NPDC056959]|uniref:hypothetical protein n=1 Tax=Lysinibacillus sp. NPDC056959 TaxID=3345981 RepID=UPI003627FF48
MSRLGQHDVGHEGVITGCDALSLRSPIRSLQGLGPTDVFCAKAKRQQRVLVLFVRKRSDSNSTDVGHEGVITGCDGFSLRSSTADPQEVAQSPLQSTNLHDIHF